jgi:GH15 family glucan-1,4-alpha-glucosidase
MRKCLFVSLIIVTALCAAGCSNSKNRELALRIRQDQRLQKVDSMAHELLKQGFNAGSGYSEVWARDLNTFILASLDVVPVQEVREALLIFFRLQQPNGEIIDGYVSRDNYNLNGGDSHLYYSPLDSTHIGFKNTVETDQETSLIQAVYKYIQKTGDTSILGEQIGEYTVRERMHRMVDYLLSERYSQEYNLLYGAMTADWGDVQPYFKTDYEEVGEIVDMNEYSHPAIDVYDNAMFLIALDNMKELGIATDAEMETYSQIKAQTRKLMWDDQRQKFRPHIYLNSSPIPEGFDEDEVYCHGGTAVAIEAGLLSREEVARCNSDMLRNVEASGMPTIGLTLYPPYPDGLFPGGMCKRYVYQNGGDWTWFGGRMIQQLIAYGFVEEAYEEISPMLDRVIENGDFNEWYGQGNKPSGSWKFKGSAGVLSKAIHMLIEWADSTGS